MATIERADAVAERAHRGQVDKADKPYIDHPRAVAEMLRPLGDHAVMVGLLHDVVEDSEVTLDDLRAMGFPDDVIRAVDAVTRRPGELYRDMIRRAAADPLGRYVKLADNIHNSGRLDALDEPVRSGLARRYAKARQPLLSAVFGDEWEDQVNGRLDVLFERMSRHQSWPCGRCGELRDHLSNHQCEPG